MTAYTLISSISAGGGVSSTYLNSIRTDLIHFSEVLAWSPTITQGVSVTRTVNEGWYGMAGKRCWAECDVTATSAGTSGSPIRLSLPVPAASSSGFMCIGSGFIIDQSPLTGNVGIVLASTTTTCGLRRDRQTADVGGEPSLGFALANTDRITFSIFYEAA